MTAPPETRDIRLDEEDEGIADTSEDESTFSARSSLYKHIQAHGRSYHAYKDGSYHRPNDETELDRLDIFNAIFKLVNQGKLYTAPIETKEVHRILDIGTGSGAWAVEMGDMVENAEILGIDLSPSMSTLVPPNVRFEITDVEDDWTYRTPFSFIHSRYMAVSLKNFPKLVQNCYEHLEPGGWAEFVDFDIVYYAQDGTLTDGHALSRWVKDCTRAVGMLGREMSPGTHLEKWMKDAGFVNVVAKKHPLPIGTWPRDPRLKEIGALNRTQLLEGIAGLSYRLFIDVLGWNKEQLEEFLEDAKSDIKSRKIHSMFDLWTVYGQRPVQ